MAEANNMVPEIRFGEFSECWREKIIGKILSETKRAIDLQDDVEYELITVRRRNEGVVSRGRLYGRQILVKNYSQLEAGDFLISKRQVVHGATGIVPEALDGAIVSNEYLVAIGNSDISTEFLTLICKRPAMYRKFFLSSYGVVIEKLFFDADDWKKRTVTIPQLTEQTQIGSYFRSLDRMIGLHQRKHDKLVTLKQAMLQKMFPQDGATTPEIRFKGFEGEWRKKPLGEIGRTQSGIGFPDAEQGGTSGTPFFKVSDMNSPKNSHEMRVANHYVSNEQVSRKGWKPISEVPGVIFAKVGAAVFLNRKRLVRDPFLIDNNMMGYLFDNDWDTQFGKTLFDTLDLTVCAQVGALPSYNGSDVEALEIKIPDKDEQNRIGAYFSSLDHLISKHTTQLEKLKNIKSACLEKMFV